jgi:hypothetical protein
MKLRHNKKRNTAFVYEALIREATVATLRGDAPKRNKIVQIIKKHFKNGSVLKKDLDCYRSLYDGQNLEPSISEKIIKEAKIAQRLIDPHGLFKQQSALIADVNKEVSPSVFGNFVPNYKTLATISQIFSGRLSPKRSVVLENQLIANMSKETKKPQQQGVDEVVLKAFVSKFNDKYLGDLIEEQKQLLSHYISSFADNSVELKMYLNEEIARLKGDIAKAKESPEIKEDKEMREKADKIVAKLDGFANQNINESVLLTVMKTQKLVKEIYSNADSN